jgi:hypothetical protein
MLETEVGRGLRGGRRPQGEVVIEVEGPRPGVRHAPLLLRLCVAEGLVAMVLVRVQGLIRRLPELAENATLHDHLLLRRRHVVSVNHLVCLRPLGQGIEEKNKDHLAGANRGLDLRLLVLL